MNIKNIALYTLLLVLMLTLTACGSNTSGGKGSVTVSLTFPSQPAALGGPAALVSASTASFTIAVYDRDTAGASLLGYARINAPVGGGTVNATLDLVPYIGPAWVVVVGTNQSGNGNSYMKTSINIQAQNNPLAMTVVEMGQGFVVPANTPSLVSPNGTLYTVNNFFLDTTSVAGFNGDYILGANVTYGAVAPTTANFISLYNPDTTNPLNALSWIVNGVATFNLDVASGAGAVNNQATPVWNRYFITINFNNGPGGTPTNTPTITNQFQGTLTFNANTGAVVPYTGLASVPAASGTTVMTLVNASWANNIAPPHASQSVILMYGQAQQTMPNIGFKSKLF